MEINFQIKLRCYHRGKNFNVVSDDEQHLIMRDCDIKLNVNKDYCDQRSLLKLFSISGITPGLQQRVSIVEMSINGNKWHNHFLFCEFHLKDNIYEKNKKLSPCWELSFNGDCMLNINFDRKQFEFFPYYISKKREDFIFSNYHLDADTNHDYWCNTLCSNEKDHNHVNRWRNEPYLPSYDGARKYDFGCFGCSVTLGTALKKGSEWPALVNMELGSVINLAEGGSGADSIFMNLRCALKEFNFDRAIILWPDLNRACYRWRVDDWHGRVLLSSNFEIPRPGEYGIWHLSIADECAKSLKRFQDGCVTGRVPRRSQRIIARTVKLLGNRQIPTWHSSWSEETYSYLSTLGLGSALLPPFPKTDRGAMDGRHPSAHQQRSWYESIKKQIASVDGKV